MRTLLLVMALISFTGCTGGSKLPYDPKLAASQTIVEDIDAAPNDAEWQVIYDAVASVIQRKSKDPGSANGDWERMLGLVRQKKCPMRVGVPDRVWFDRTQFLIIKCIDDEFARTTRDLTLAPTDEALKKRRADLLAVHNKWAAIYDQAAEGLEEQLQSWILPPVIHPLEK
ncbi:MAG: hypothetical protein ABI743_14675 [bacterium]